MTGTMYYGNISSGKGEEI